VSVIGGLDLTRPRKVVAAACRISAPRSPHPSGRLRGRSLLAALVAAAWISGCGACERAPVAAPEPAVPVPPSAAGPGPITALWAAHGEDKVARAEPRASPGGSGRGVASSLWDGQTVTLSAARNEIVAFQLVVEAAEAPAEGVRVALPSLAGPDQRSLSAGPGTRELVYDWRERHIELFLVGYQRLRGLSRTPWEAYDERHVPKRLRRPHGADGEGEGGWTDRPDHDAEYPEVAIPLETVEAFDVAAGHNQAVWVDIAVPRDAPAGLWRGDLSVQVGQGPPRLVPVRLTVVDFALPDEPAAQTMVFTGHADLAARYLGHPTPADAAERARARLIRDRHHLMARRHRVTLFDANLGDASEPARDAPTDEWLARLDGSLFSAAHGYAGPGENVPNGLFVIGAYGSWGWQAEGKAAMWSHLDAWALWFRAHAPTTEVLLYLIDESADTKQIETWAGWMRANPGPGAAIRSFATLDLPTAVADTPSLDVPASTIAVADTSVWREAAATLRQKPAGRLVMYNGRRPASGTFATEEEGIALRQLAWTQVKHAVWRWFFWESTYYTDVQGGGGAGDVISDARTFGAAGERDAVYGETGWRYTNGDGVLFYPGTDRVFPAQSRGLDGPMASLRLKHWRRGIQDAGYLALARARDPAATDAIVEAMIPRVLWEVGVDNPSDPTYKRADISWPTDAEVWDAARAKLTAVILGGTAR
jgi:hypothetical protein